jgi:hypothetical protein
MSTTRLTLTDLDTLTLSIGTHEPDAGKACVMEAHTVRRGLPWSDEPDDVSPVIRAFAVRLNDIDGPYGPAIRARLWEMDRAGRFDDTAGDPARERRRAYIAADWAVRECASLALRAAGLTVEADTLAALAPIGNRETADAAADAAARAAYAAARAAAAYAAVYAAYEAAAAADDAAAAAAAARAAEAAAYEAAVVGAGADAGLYELAFDCLERMLVAG